MTKLTIEELVPFGRKVDPSGAFHLSPCVCGAPTWQQPCPHCGFYPDHDYLDRNRQLVEAHRDRTTKEAFVASVGRAGGIVHYWAAREVERLKQLLADYDRRYSFDKDRDEVAAALKKREAASAAVAEVEEPGAAEVWDAFRDPAAAKRLNGYEEMERRGKVFAAICAASDAATAALAALAPRDGGEVHARILAASENLGAAKGAYHEAMQEEFGWGKWRK